MNLNGKKSLKISQKYQTKNNVKLSMSKYPRSLMAKLCLNILPLALETDQVTNAPPNERKCFSCNNYVEDELHVVYQCNFLRSKVWSNPITDC